MEQFKDKTGSTPVMKAVRQHKFGGPEVLVYEDAPVPKLNPGEVLIRVHAVGLNPPDWYLRDGYKMLPPEWQPQVPFPIILGTDVSGVVATVAEDVKDFSVGDEVAYGPGVFTPRSVACSTDSRYCNGCDANCSLLF